MLWRWLKSSQHNPITVWLPIWFTTKIPSSYSKVGDKNVQLVLQHCCKMSWIAMLCVLPPSFKPVLEQIRLLQVARVLTPDWINYTGVTWLVAKQVYLEPVKHATCTDFVAKIRTTLYFPQHSFATWNNLICCKTDSKTCNIAIQLNLQQCFKTSRTFSLPVLPYLCGWNDIKIILTFLPHSFVLF